MIRTSTLVIHDRLLEMLEYDPVTGVFRWRKRPAKNVKIGSVAGTLQANGYRYMKLDKVDYLAQRLAWFYMTKEWPRVVRFVDKNNRNCAFSNLTNESVVGEWFDQTTEEGRQAYDKAYRALFPGNHRRRYLARVWGLTPEEYDEKLQAQNGACAICKTVEVVKVRAKSKMPIALAVDHDHATGAIRDLLCRRCNTMLGAVNDDPEVLMNATAYLKRHAAPKLREVA